MSNCNTTHSILLRQKTSNEWNKKNTKKNISLKLYYHNAIDVKIAEYFDKYSNLTNKQLFIRIMEEHFNK
jgi:hypothetical protein